MSNFARPVYFLAKLLSRIGGLNCKKMFKICAKNWGMKTHDLTEELATISF